MKVEKKGLVSFVPNRSSMSLRNRTNLEKSLESIHNFCKYQLVFRSKAALGNSFQFEDCSPKDVISGVACTFKCEICNKCDDGDCARHMDVIIGEYIGLTKEKVKIKNSFQGDFLLFCNHFITAKICVLSRSTIALKFMSDSNSDLLILEKKLQSSDKSQHTK